MPKHSGTRRRAPTSDPRRAYPIRDFNRPADIAAAEATRHAATEAAARIVTAHLQQPIDSLSPRDAREILQREHRAISLVADALIEWGTIPDEATAALVGLAHRAATLTDTAITLHRLGLLREGALPEWLVPRW